MDRKFITYDSDHFKFDLRLYLMHYVNKNENSLGNA